MDNDLTFLLLAGGPALLACGFEQLKEKRLIENTPTSKIRSAAMGLVEIHGRLRARQPDNAPISKLPCSWWRCAVQEKVRSRRHSYWRTLHTFESDGLFYVEDETGRVLVDAHQADVRLQPRTHYLHGSAAAVAEALQSWSVKTEAFFGWSRPLRVLEYFFTEGQEAFLLGEMKRRDAFLESRQQRFRDHLRTLKQDSDAMKSADADGDGRIDAREWDAFRLAEEERFLEAEQKREGEIPESDRRVIACPADRPFIISSDKESALVSSGGWMSGLQIFGGLVLTPAAVWLGILQQVSGVVIVGILAAGFFGAKFLVTRKERNGKPVIPKPAV